jgi:hypothetical protein
VAGQGSPLHAKHRVWLHRVAVANLPEDYVSRLTDMVPGEFKFLKLLVPDPCDCILSKLERNAAKDRDDADFLFRSQKLDAGILRDRYKTELRHNLIGNVDWHDRTLELGSRSSAPRLDNSLSPVCTYHVSVVLSNLPRCDLQEIAPFAH